MKSDKRFQESTVNILIRYQFAFLFIAEVIFNCFGVELVSNFTNNYHSRDNEMASYFRNVFNDVHMQRMAQARQ